MKWWDTRCLSFGGAQVPYGFHEEAKIEEAKQRRTGEQIACIPEETEALRGLGLVNRELVRELGRRCGEQRIATVDQDATIIESRKQEALRAYEGERGYQPMSAVWAERNVVLADEFRDGNVPAMMAPLRVAKQSYAALPETVKEYYFRGDSACHESQLINWLRNEEREEGPRGFIGFAISARMSGALHKEIVRIPEEGWQAYGKEHAKQIRECAEVSFVPERNRNTKTHSRCAMWRYEYDRGKKPCLRMAAR